MIEYYIDKYMSKQLIATIIFFLLFCLIGQSPLLSQSKGEPPPAFNPDTTFIFKSPRPLISADNPKKELKNAWGFNLIFSGNGFGAGLFLEREMDKNLFVFSSLYMSGARNTDEFEVLDQYGNYVVPGKINRLFMFPLTFGFEYYVFTETLSDNFKPYLDAGLGPTLIISTPYEREFFNAFGYTQSYVRFGSFIGLGANFSPRANSLMGVNIRYYFIPFGGHGLESIEGLPIHDFGGLFLSLNGGVKY
jgi:hypothetical protein